MHARTRLVVVATTLATGVLTLVSPADAVVPQASECLIASHRGITNVPNTTATENTLTAFRRAVAAQADILEIDVRATSDDLVVLMHDATVDRTTSGTGRVRFKTGQQIKALTTDDKKSGSLDAAGQPISGRGGVPYLSEVMPYAAAQRKEILLEIKAAGGSKWWNQLKTQVNSYPRGVTIMSFDQTDLDKAKALMPEVPAMLISSTQVAVTALSGLSGIVIQQAALTTQYQAELDAADMQIHPYVENSSTTWQRDLGKVTSIITNDPGALAAFRSTNPACPQYSG